VFRVAGLFAVGHEFAGAARQPVDGHPVGTDRVPTDPLSLSPVDEPANGAVGIIGTIELLVADDVHLAPE